MPPTTITITGSMSTRMRTLVERFYNHLLDPINPPPVRAPEALLEHVAGRPLEPGPLAGKVASAPLQNGEWVAVVTVGQDRLLTVTDDDGPRIVGAFVDGFEPWLGPQQVRRLLVLGSDARVGENQLRLRADSIHILSIDATSGSGSFVGIPRDSWVRGSKITNHLPRGGPEFMLDIVGGLSGLEFEGYAAVGFEGFIDLFQALGDLEIDLPRAMRSGNNWDSYPAGEQVLSPALVLRLARIRKGLPGGDFDRSENQGLIVLAAMAMIQEMGIEMLPHWVRIFDRFGFTDLTTAQLLTFGATAYLAPPENITNVVVPGSLGTVGSASVVFLGGGADAVFADAADAVLGN